jgi:2-polyprenyl-3-methyl-5-hydroxy-6-metoxy-1,4-benzoquinol methylase
MNDDSYDEPKNADLEIKNHGENDALYSAREIVNYFISKATEDAERGRQPHWDKFYKKNIIPVTPSSFCEFVCSQIVKGSRLLEIGCGNGRDAVYFGNNGINVIAIDRSETAISECKKNYIELPVIFLHGSLDEVKEVNRDEFDVIYSRFVIHAMPENEEIAMLTKSFDLLKNNGQIYIECRSIKDPLARKGEIISPTERIHGHYRRFIVKDNLLERLENIGFSILDVVESDNLAVYKNDNPVVIRVKAKKIQS